MMSAKAMYDQRGVTLVELMIGMTIGLIISAGALSAFSASFSANKTAIQIAHVNDEMNNILQIISRELRRAGYNDGQAPANFNTVTVASAGGVAASCITYSFDTPPLNNTPDNFERRGFRRNGQVVEWRKSNDASAPDCNNATGWAAMNGTSIVEVTGLEFTQVNACAVTVKLQGKSVKDSAVQFELTETIVMQNITCL